MKTLLLSFATLLIVTNMNAQHVEPIGKMNKNLIYGGLGTGRIYFPAYLYYERHLNGYHTPCGICRIQSQQTR
jgi:hypothetical protein